MSRFTAQSADVLTRLAESNLTSADVKIACEDLKVLGKKDFKTLLKWRVAIREQVSQCWLCSIGN